MCIRKTRLGKYNLVLLYSRILESNENSENKIKICIQRRIKLDYQTSQITITKQQNQIL